MAQERWDYDAPAPASIGIDDFAKVDLRVGRVVACDPFPEARKPSYRVTVDLGPLGTRRSSVAVAAWYRPEDLVGRLVVCVVNFPPRRIAGFSSEVLVTGAVQPDGHVALLGADPTAAPGTRVF